MQLRVCLLSWVLGGVDGQLSGETQGRLGLGLLVEETRQDAGEKLSS